MTNFGWGEWGTDDGRSSASRAPQRRAARLDTAAAGSAGGKLRKAPHQARMTNFGRRDGGLTKDEIRHPERRKGAEFASNHARLVTGQTFRRQATARE